MTSTSISSTASLSNRLRPRNLSDFDLSALAGQIRSQMDEAQLDEDACAYNAFRRQWRQCWSEQNRRAESKRQNEVRARAKNLRDNPDRLVALTDSGKWFDVARAAQGILPKLQEIADWLHSHRGLTGTTLWTENITLARTLVANFNGGDF